MESLSGDCPCSLNEAELFDPVAKQIVLSSAKEHKYTPVASINNSGGVIEFNVEGSADELIDLNDTELIVSVKVTKTDGSNLAKTDVITPVNNWLHCMFSDVKLEIGNKAVEGGESLYPYKAYFYNLFTHDYYSKRTQLTNSGWYKDTASAINAATNNAGVTARRALIAESRTAQLGGPLLLDMMLQNKYLLPNVGLRISLTQNKPEFQTSIYTATDVANKATAVKVSILSAELYIRKVKALPSFIQSIEDNLSLQNAVYPIQRTVMNTFTIPSGVTSHRVQSLFNSDLPKLIFIGVVSNAAYNGAYGENPFNFNHNNVNGLKLYDSSGTVTFEEYKPDFANALVAREYNSLFKAMGIYNQSENFDITINEFCNGFTIYAFNMTPDAHISGHQQISRQSTLCLDLTFSAATTASLSLIAMGVMDARIEITKLRKVICSWMP